MQNPFRFALLLSGLVVLATSCPTVLNRDRAEEIKVFGGQAASASTSFLKGAPVGALSIGRRLEAQVSKNPQIAAFMNRYTPRMKQQLSAVRLQDYSGCGQPLEGSDFSDADQDDIPVSPDGKGGAFKYTFSAGCTKNIGGDIFAISGSITLKDANDSSNTSGYTFSADNFKLTYTSTVDDGNGGTITGSIALTLNGTDTVGTAGASGTGLYKDAQTTRLDFSAIAGKDSITATFSTTSNLEYSADTTITGSPFGRGYVNSSSKFAYNLAAKIGGVSGSASGNFNLKLINVFINRDLCADDVTDSGLAGKDASVAFSDDSNNVLTWNIAPAGSSSACGTGVWSLNGATLP
jgi:hypothetical protein